MAGNGLINVDLGGVIGAIGIAADNLLTSKEEEMEISLKDKGMDAGLMMGQMEVNKVEAASGKAWRYWVGRVGAISLALYFIPQYIIASILWCRICWDITPVNGVITLPAYPASADALLELIMGMLGLGIVKAVENIKGPNATGAMAAQAKEKSGFKWPWHRG